MSREVIEARHRDGAEYLVTANGLEIFDHQTVRYLEAHGELVAGAGLVQLWRLAPLR